MPLFDVSPGGESLAVLFNQTLGGSQANFDLQGIPGNFTSLELHFLLRSDYAGANFDSALVRFNGDSAANYCYGGFHASSANNSGLDVANGATSLVVFVGSAGATAGYFGSGEFKVPFYAGTTAFKLASGLYADFVTSTTLFGRFIGGVWENTAAINRITISPLNGANWVTGSAVALYAR